MMILTGGAGFIGSVFLNVLNAEGITDILVVDKLRLAHKWKNLNNKFFADFLDKDRFLEALEGNRLGNVKTVIHLGACSSTTEKDADYIMENNFVYSRRIAAHCAARNIKLIYASSAATYGDGSAGYGDGEENISALKPLNMYGYSKHLFDLWVLRHGLHKKFTGFKYFNVFGPNEYHKGEMRSVVCKAFDQIGKTGSLKLFRSHRKDFPDGGQMRDFVYVKDAVKVMLFFLKNPERSGIFNLGTGKARSFRDLALAVFKAMKKKTAVRYIPMPPEVRDQYQYYTQADLTRLRQAGYQEKFQPLEEAVGDYVKNHLTRKDPYL